MNTSPENHDGFGDSLIDGKAPPATSTSYWDRSDIGAVSGSASFTGRRPIPTWFWVATVAAVLAAMGIVVAIMYVTSGSAP